MHRSLKSALTLSCLAISITAFAGITTPMAHAGNLYEQPSTFPGSPFGWASQIDTSPGGSGAYATEYDDFILTGTDNVTAVDWSGGFFNPQVQVPISAFTINFYADDSGIPGTELFTDTIPGDADETFVGDSIFGDLGYTYSTNLDSPFTATAGTTYWISIVPSIADEQPQWAWETGTGGDGTSYQEFFGTPIVRPTDEAFGLSGGPAPVPEPSTVAGFVVGMLGLGALILRRRRLSCR